MAAESPMLWVPSEDFQAQSNLRTYMRWLHERHGLQFNDYAALWRWSVEQTADFWAGLWQYYNIQAVTPYTTVLQGEQMPDINWFPGATLNYAAQVFRHHNDQHPALLFQSERRPLTAISWDDLRANVSRIAAALRSLGVQAGDRVVAYMPNIPETLYAFLASASLGAVWSSCSPDFGSPSVIDRFKQIEPKILFAVDGYQYGGKYFDRRETVAELQAALPSLEHTILLPYLNPSAGTAGLANLLTWEQIQQYEGELSFAPVSFEHPLWVLYSSGTTGLPKPIVHSQGGILLEHIKSLDLHFDLKPGERFFWYSTTGWMMWNFLIGALLVGATPLLYDGSPAWPDMGVLWRFAEQSRMNVFGTSAGYILALIKSEVRPDTDYDLSALKCLSSTGSPLPPEGFEWVYAHVKPDIWLASYSGGTDVCSGFVGGCPLLPVYAGEIQCRILGVRAEAYDPQGQPLIGRMGELVISRPMPSMPIYFWNDPGKQRYRASYFEVFPGVWRHGDWVEINARGGLVIYGRSDSTINRMGVRMGTSEIYSAVARVPEVVDSLVLDLEGPGGQSYMPLFVVLREGLELNAELIQQIKREIRSALSPRHVPDSIHRIAEVPYTLSGKKLEVPIKKILSGTPISQAANPDSLRNPAALAYFANWKQD
jgi:acetoacetyl-CoA synthetase